MLMAMKRCMKEPVKVGLNTTLPCKTLNNEMQNNIIQLHFVHSQFANFNHYYGYLCMDGIGSHTEMNVLPSSFQK